MVMDLSTNVVVMIIIHLCTIQQQYVIFSNNAGSAEGAGELYDDPKMMLNKATNFAELSQLRQSLSKSNSAINIVYLQQDKDPCLKSGAGGAGGVMTMAEATSWEPQQVDKEQQQQQQQYLPQSAMEAIEEMDAADLYDIRMKMEEKRKRIEADKRHMEIMATKQREKVGKAAFLQVIHSLHTTSLRIPSHPTH